MEITEKMNILHVNMSLDPVIGGGTVERICQLHKALLKLGVESQIVTINDLNADFKTVSVEKVTYLPCLNRRWFIPYPSISSIKKLVEQANVIHLMNHWTLINAWVYFWARRLEKPYVICPAGALTIFGRSKIKKYLYQRLVGNNIIRNASAAIAISPDEVELIAKYGLEPHKISHIPNGVNEDDFSSNDVALFRIEFGIGDAPYILFVGRLNPIKGPDLLLNAFAKLQNDLPHHLIFAGPDGGMSEHLKQQVSDLKLIDRVHFIGYLGGDMKSNAFHGADLLAIPSRHEAMSIVALEAAIASTPVILTDRCGFSSLADVGAAIEVPATIDGISAGLKRLLIDNCDLERMGKYGRTFALEHYTWSIMAQRFIDLANQIKA